MAIASSSTSSTDPAGLTGAATDPGWLHVGRVGKPHGLDGSFLVSEPNSSMLQVGVSVTIAGMACVIERRAGHDARVIVRVGGCTDRDAVEAIRGQALLMARDLAPALEEDEARDLERKFRKSEFDLDDFLDQMRQIRRMGPLQNLLGMLPGVGKELRGVKIDEREFDRIQAIILSMTPQERRHPELIKGSRRLRIAKGSGTNVQAVKQLIKQFDQMRKVMKAVASGKTPDLGALMRQAR